jgi:hypothetical protein
MTTLVGIYEKRCVAGTSAIIGKTLETRVLMTGTDDLRTGRLRSVRNAKRDTPSFVGLIRCVKC